jgi:hypothetical protein
MGLEDTIKDSFPCCCIINDNSEPCLATCCSRWCNLDRIDVMVVLPKHSVNMYLWG